MPFDVPEDGDYELYTQVAQGSDYGIYTVLLDGKPPVAPRLEHEPGADVRPQTQFDGYALETYVGVDYQVGWPRLDEGPPHADLRVPRQERGLERLQPRRRQHRPGEDGRRGLGRSRDHPAAAAAVGKRPRGGARSRIPIRSRAASRRSRCGTGRRPRCRPCGALQAGLQDLDANVRMMSANAIAAIGTGAAPAVPALIAACSVKGEQVHVLRACAPALGAIGHAAAPALPILRELLALPRVRWAAEAAIRSIE